MNPIQRIINLIKKTGDKAIILDENGEPNYVLMTISDYERLNLGKSEVGGLTEAELLAKINRDIAIWKDIQEIEELPIDQYDFVQDLGNFSEFCGEVEECHDFESIRDIIDSMELEDDADAKSQNWQNHEENYDADAKSQNWQNHENKDYFEDDKNESDFDQISKEKEDDRYYFEPVE